MYFDKEIGHCIYENIEDFANAEVTGVYEDLQFYYVKLKAETLYDNCIWKTNKKTGAVSYMMFTDFILNCADSSEEISVDAFKSMLEKTS